MARKGWGQLSPAYRARLTKGGVTQSDYEGGVSLGKARGHAKTPEHPTDRIERSKYPEYFDKRKDMTARLVQKKINLWGSSTKWDSIRSEKNVRDNPPSMKMLQWALDATEDELLDAIRENPEVIKWLGYH